MGEKDGLGGSAALAVGDGFAVAVDDGGEGVLLPEKAIEMIRQEPGSEFFEREGCWPAANMPPVAMRVLAKRPGG